MLCVTLSSSDCTCVYKLLCAAQIQCRNAHVLCCRKRYLCAGSALCMNIDVSLKAYFSSLHILLGTAVAQWLRCCYISEGCWFDLSWFHSILH